MVPYKTGLANDGSSLSDDLGMTGMHIEAVTVIQRERITQVNSAGVKEALGPKGQSLAGRGSSVCVTLWTECGRRIFITYQFHKGEVYYQTHEDEPLGLDPEVPTTELWRD